MLCETLLTTVTWTLVIKLLCVCDRPAEPFTNYISRAMLREDNYDISGIRSDDSTDDESEPKRRIPPWAQGRYTDDCNTAEQVSLILITCTHLLFVIQVVSYVPHSPHKPCPHLTSISSLPTCWSHSTSTLSSARRRRASTSAQAPDAGHLPCTSHQGRATLSAAAPASWMKPRDSAASRLHCCVTFDYIIIQTFHFHRPCACGLFCRICTCVLLCTVFVFLFVCNLLSSTRFIH